MYFQYCTFSIKSISFLQLNGIFVIVENSGRFDHLLGNINTLYKAEKIIQNVQVMFNDEKNLLLSG